VGHFRRTSNEILMNGLRDTDHAVEATDEPPPD
jgi:hypothetical protein